MYEVELKVRAPHGAVQDRLDDLGAEHLGTVLQEDTYYDAPHRDFAATDEALRIRRESRAGGELRDEDGSPAEKEPPGEDEPLAGDQSQAFLTYKGPLVEEESKTRQEAETAVAEAAAVAEVLDGLGFEPAATVRKERERYVLAGYTVTLDTVEGLGEFVEVESEADVETEADIEATREGAVAVLDRLGLDADAGIRTSYLGLLLADEGGNGDDERG